MERHFLGVVDVDSGTLIVGDPSYLLRHAAQDREGVDYQAGLSVPRRLSVPR
jgi:hypothetical protein